MGGTKLRRPRSREPWRPISPGRWSEQVQEGPVQVFCSACGSRSLHKQQLEDSSASLSQQVSILREIARRQGENIKELEVELQQALLLQSRGKGAVAKFASDDVARDLTVERAEVERLHAELRVWRREADGVHAEQDKAAAARREEEVRRWKLERDALNASLEELQDKVRHLISAKHSPRDTMPRIPEVDFARLEQDVERDRQYVARTRSRAAAIRQEVQEEERKTHGELLKKTDADEECTLLDRRLGVEKELKMAQQAQLQSLRDTTSALRFQLQQADRENAELKSSLDQNQEVLRRLSSRQAK
mmetsp:Transcript_33693/g.60976  ORF Transcript_33693/g.60976 Transcript_33693/m.60976 type:complete len:305 (-) Transcript_33693:49-963(-)